jgi:hypothetical protein
MYFLRQGVECVWLAPIVQTRQPRWWRDLQAVLGSSSSNAIKQTVAKTLGSSIKRNDDSKHFSRSVLGLVHTAFIIATTTSTLWQAQ